MFSSARASGQLGPLMNQFGLPSEAVDAANKGGKTPIIDMVLLIFISTLLVVFNNWLLCLT